MRTILTRVLVVLVASVSQVYGQTIKQDSDKSICSNVVALTGNVNINCSNLTLEQRKMIEQIPAILKLAISDQEYLKAIKDELDKRTQVGTSIGAVTQGLGSAFSVGQQGGITAGTLNVDTRRHIVVSDAQVAAITDAMKPFSGRSALIVENGNQQDVVDAAKRVNDALIAAGIKSDRMSGMAMHAGGDRNTALFVGYNDRTADMGKALLDAFGGLVPAGEPTYHVYDEKSADTIQIIISPMD